MISRNVQMGRSPSLKFIASDCRESVKIDNLDLVEKPPRALSAAPRIVRSVINSSSGNQEDWGNTLHSNEQFALRIALDYREKLSKIIPSLARRIEEEQEEGWEWKGGCIILQAQIIDHSWEYIEQTAQPAVEHLKELWKDFNDEMGRLQNQLQECKREKLILQSENENMHAAYQEGEEDLKNLKVSNENLERLLRQKQLTESDCSLLYKAEIEALEKQLFRTQYQLNTALQDLESQAALQEEMHECLRTQYQSLNEVIYQRDFAISERMDLEKKILDSQQEVVKPDDNKLQLQSHKSDDIKDEVVEVNGFIEIPYDGDVEDSLPQELFKKQNDGILDIYSLNEELQICEYENEDDIWLDELDSCDSDDSEMVEYPVQIPDNSACQPSLEAVSKISSTYVKPEVYGIRINENASADEALSITHNECINIGEHLAFPTHSSRESNLAFPTHISRESKPRMTTEVVSSRRYKPRARISQSPQYIPGLGSNLRRTSKVPRTTTYWNSLTVDDNEDVVAIGPTSFKAAFSMFKKLEEINPGIVNPGRMSYTFKNENFSEKTRSISLKPPGLEPVSTQMKRKSKIIAKVKVTHKKYFLKPIYKGWLQILKSSENSLKWRCKFGHLFFVCLGALPATTNTNSKDPIYTKNKIGDELRPCLFWFESKEQYKKLLSRSIKYHVRSQEFQVAFSETALGIVVLQRECVISAREERAIQQLSKMTHSKVILPQNLLDRSEEISKDHTDFFVIVKKLNDSFDSHKFRAASEKQRDKWMRVIQRLVRKRLLNTTELAISRLRDSTSGRQRFDSFRSSISSMRLGDVPSGFSRFYERNSNQPRNWFFGIGSNDQKIDHDTDDLDLPIRFTSRHRSEEHLVKLPKISSRSVSQKVEKSYRNLNLEEITVDFGEEYQSLRVV